ncbi:hypothetical protein SAY87_030887 [Trapa incisa]|uniref:Uncharacterized protein n=1 Tax=Trapa incisa TaxID=236973 RepID=A0AAN7KP77_9MYRT|nr:hypothetical protein SAY87_030887 [Trapa incisa]
MAAASPAQGNTAAAETAAFTAKHTPPKTLRGLNKPKCIQCGNVARSRCPYQSCKSCCSRAQNPCHIHVLKSNATFLDKSPISSTHLFNQHSTEPSSAGSSHRVASLRQLSNSFAQFNNVHVSIRAKKPLTKKDAAAINEWRFSKLKEFQDRNIDLENEAFDRYMQNIDLLKEVFSVKSLPEEAVEDPTQKLESVMTEMKIKLRSNEARKENFRKRVQHIVDGGLRKLQKQEVGGGISDFTGQNGDVERQRPKLAQVEKASLIVDLNEKLSRARNEDLKSCLELKAKLLNPHLTSTKSEAEESEKCPEQVEEDQSVHQVSTYLQPKLFIPVKLDQESISRIDSRFPSLNSVEDAEFSDEGWKIEHVDR